jgi:hypothetical protein
MANRKHLLATLTLLGATALSGSSIGADAKVIGPTNCAGQNSDPLGLEFTTNAVTNLTGGAFTIECSIDRDNTGNTNGLSDLEIAVTVPLGRLACDAFSFDRAGNLLKMVSREANGQGTQILDFGSSLNVSANKGHFAVSCFADHGTKIHAIYYNEY